MLAGEPDSVGRLIGEYRKSMSPVCWPVPPGMAEANEVKYRNHTAIVLASGEIGDVVRQYVGWTVAQAQGLYSAAYKHLLQEPLRGVGIELGSGCGVFSAVIAHE